MVIEWIIFDVWGVIYRPRNLVKEMLIPFIKKWDPKISENQIYNLYLEASLGIVSSEEIWEVLNLKLSHPEIENLYINSHKSILEPDFKQVAKKLRTRFKLGIISNDVKEWSLALLEKFDIKDYFNLILISGEMKIRKPDKAIFSKFIDLSNSNSENCIFIDDRLENLRAAKEFGMNCLRFIKKETKVPFCSEFEISNLIELEHVLDNFFA
jgi:putative hydrolase of the HAD superfamily